MELASLMGGLVRSAKEDDIEIKSKGTEIESKLKTLFLSNTKSGFFPNLFKSLKRKLQLFTDLLTKLVGKRKKRSLTTDLQEHFDMIVNAEGIYDINHRQEALDWLYNKFSDLSRPEMSDFLEYNDIALQGKIRKQDLKELLGKHFFETKGLKASNYLAPRMNTRSQGLADGIDETEETEIGLIDDSMSGDNAGTGLTPPTEILNLNELNNKQMKITDEVDQLQDAIGTLIDGQARIGIDTEKLQKSVSTLTHNLVDLESGQSTIKSKIEAELGKKVSIEEMRTKLEKESNKLMEHIEKLNKEFIRINEEVIEDDTKMTALSSSISQLNDETDRIKQGLKEQKNQLSQVSNVETNLWGDLNTQITKVEGLNNQITKLGKKVESLNINTKLEEFKSLYDGRLTVLEREKRQDGNQVQEEKMENKLRTTNVLQNTVESIQGELRQLQEVLRKQTTQTTSSKSKISTIEIKILAIEELVKELPTDRVRLLKVETDQGTLEERNAQRVSTVEGNIDEIETSITALKNENRNEKGNNIASNNDLDRRIKEQTRSVEEIKTSLADLRSNIEALNGNNENIISQTQLTGLRRKLTEFEDNQNGIHAELMKLVRTTNTEKEKNELYKEKNDLELGEINRQVGLLETRDPTNRAVNQEGNDMDLTKYEEKINLVLRLLWENLVSEIEKIITSEILLQSGVYDYSGLEGNREKQGIILIEKGSQEFVHTVFSTPITLVPLVPRTIVVDDFIFRLEKRRLLQYGAINEMNKKENCKQIKKKKDFYFCEANSWGKMHECAFCHLTDHHDDCTFVQLKEIEEKEKNIVWIEEDNKLIERKVEKEEVTEVEEEKKKVEGTDVKNVYFLNVQTLRVEVDEWLDKNVNIKKIVGILDDLPWNEIGIALSVLNLLILVSLVLRSVLNYFKEVKRIFYEKEREREQQIEDDLEMEDLVARNTHRNTITSVLRS